MTLEIRAETTQSDDMMDPMANWSSEMTVSGCQHHQNDDAMKDGSCSTCSTMANSSRMGHSSRMSNSSRMSHSSRISASARSRADKIRQKHANAQAIKQTMRTFQKQASENQDGQGLLKADVEAVKGSLSAMEALLKNMNQQKESSSNMKKKCKSSGSLGLRRSKKSSGSGVSLSASTEHGTSGSKNATWRSSRSGKCPSTRRKTANKDGKPPRRSRSNQSFAHMRPPPVKTIDISNNEKPSRDAASKPVQWTRSSSPPAPHEPEPGIDAADFIAQVLGDLGVKL